MFLFSSHGRRSFTALPYERGDVLVFGQETLGLPADLVESRGAWRIPMPGPTRSLNLANAVSIVAYRALERIEPHWFSDEAPPGS